MTPLTRALPLRAALLALALTLTGTGCSRPDTATGTPTSGTLVTVSAYGEVRQAPDIATLSTGVVSLAADANTAIARNSEQMARVVASLKAAGINEADVQTSGVSLNPDYLHQANRPPRIRGYYASNTVNVRVREIGRLGQILDTLVATGANNVNGPLFDIEDKDAVLDKARAQALSKARARADAYAKGLGLKVLRVVSIDETGGRGTPRPVIGDAVMVEQAAAVANTSAPIAPGQNALGVNLDVMYALGK